MKGADLMVRPSVTTLLELKILYENFLPLLNCGVGESGAGGGGIGPGLQVVGGSERGL